MKGIGCLHTIQWSRGWALKTEGKGGGGVLCIRTMGVFNALSMDNQRFHFSSFSRISYLGQEKKIVVFRFPDLPYFFDPTLKFLTTFDKLKH